MNTLMLDDQFQLLRDDAGSEASIQTGTDDDVCEDEDYYFVDVVFLVEDRLFKVPRWCFEADSAVFRDMFQLPVPKNVVPDGSSKEKPLHLDGVAKREFTQLLRVMYPRHFGREETLAVPEWTAVLKLATMWELSEIRKLAIRRMSGLTIDFAERVVLAREYRVAEWMVPALNGLAQREEPLGVLDVELLGWDYVLKLARVRECYRSGGDECCPHCGEDLPPRSPRGKADFTNVIRRYFEKDLELIA